MGRAPDGSTGTSTRRSRKALTSYNPAYARQPAPIAPTPSRPLTIALVARFAVTGRRLQARPAAHWSHV
jgi:hypothetical protein